VLEGTPRCTSAPPPPSARDNRRPAAADDKRRRQQYGRALASPPGSGYHHRPGNLEGACAPVLRVACCSCGADARESVAMLVR